MAQLQAVEQRLDSLIREDRSVRLSFDLSYQTLSPQLQQFFVSLGSFGGDDFSTAGAAYVADIAEENAPHFLDELIQLSLVQSSRIDRYSLHSLLRDYAREKQPDAQINQRMVHWFVEYAAQNVEDYAQVGVELSNLTFALDTALALKMTARFIAGTLDVFPTWRIRGDMTTAVPHLKNALTIAQNAGNRKHQSRLLSFLGVSSWALGKPQESEAYHKQGLQLAYAIEDINLISKFLIDLGNIAGGYFGDYDKAKIYLLEAKSYLQQTPNSERSIALFLTLANIAYEQGNWAEAEQYWQEGLVHDEKHGRSNINSMKLRQNLAVLAMVQGQFDDANTYLNDALTLARDLKAMGVMSTTLTMLGQIANEQGDYQRAKGQLDEALILARDIDSPEAIVQALSVLGKWALNTNDFVVADTYLQEALVISQKVNLSW
ncbi:MAG: hypothetical protein R8K20_02610, partial [Gallionellaceae bacterium]